MDSEIFQVFEGKVAVTGFDPTRYREGSKSILGDGSSFFERLYLRGSYLVFFAIS